MSRKGKASRGTRSPVRPSTGAGGADPEGAGPSGLPAIYEGPEVLSALLRSAGSPHDADEVAALFSRAQADGEDRSSVIPALFPDEPRFASPDAARRLYGNLFGLWARLAAGLGVADDAPAAAEPDSDRSSVLRQAQGERTLSPESGSAPLRSAGSAPVPLPERGLAPGDEVPAEVIEAVWKHLAAAPGAELSRLRDRFSNAQPDLAAWLDSVELPEAGAAAALDLAFEAWVMFDRAFGDRLRHVEYRDLRALEAGPPALDEHQPAFAAYVGEQLDLLTDEDPGFDPGAREGVERVAAVVAGALTRAVQLVS